MPSISLPKGYQRLGPFPLDDTFVFDTLASLETYASTNASAYSGQVCTVSSTGNVYIIKNDKSLSQISNATDVVNLSGTQTITGTKTFNAPVTITSNFLTIQSDALNPSYGLKITNTNSFDPGTPLLVDGRARVVHGMSFAAGIANFTNNSDHSHVLWTAQGRGSWQMIQNGGTSSDNRNTFLLTTVGSTASQTFFNESNAYSIDTTAVVSSSVSPFLATGIKINYNTAGSGLAVGDYVQITFNPGAAGVVANTYPGVVTAGPTEVTIAGSTRFQYTFSLEDFTSGVNWVSASARSELIYLNANSVNNVRVSYAPTQIDGTRVSLTGNYSSIGRYVLVNINGHTAFEGESAVLAITGSTKIGLVAGSYNCFVKKVIDSNNFVISVGNAKTGWASTSGTTGSSGWVLYKGSTDAIHQYTPALQHFYYQRFPTSDTSATTTGGNRNIALGNSAEVDGDFSYSLGHKSAVYGAHSVALGGEDSFVTGNYSTVLGGQGLTSSGTHQTIIGKYNAADSSGTKPFIVGWGTSDTNRSNLLELSTTALSVNTAISSTGSITGNSIVKSGGTSSQFLKADGSVDSNSYSIIGHTHSTSNITNLYQPTPEQDPDATSAILYSGYKLDLVGLRSYIAYDGGSGVVYGCSYNNFTNRWGIYDNESTFLTSTSDGLYPWLATWPGNAVTKYSYPRVAGAALAATASDGVSNYAARADHVHPYPTALQIGAAPLVGGKVPIQYMPSAADDVLVFSDRSDFPATGESGKIYLAQYGSSLNDVWYEGGRTYYWGGSPLSYIEVAPLSVYNPSDADAFVLWAGSDPFIPTDITAGRPSYTMFNGRFFVNYYMQYEAGRWIIYSVGEEYYLEAEAAPGTEAYPWLANWGTSNYITRVGSYSYSQSLIPRKGASIGSSGTSERSARADHVHPLPTAEEIGAASKNFAVAMAIALG